jgi:hypothetical protein
MSLSVPVLRPSGNGLHKPRAVCDVRTPSVARVQYACFAGRFTPGPNSVHELRGCARPSLPVRVGILDMQRTILKIHTGGCAVYVHANLLLPRSEIICIMRAGSPLSNHHPLLRTLAYAHNPSSKGTGSWMLPYIPYRPWIPRHFGLVRPPPNPVPEDCAAFPSYWALVCMPRSRLRILREPPNLDLQ